MQSQVFFQLVHTNAGYDTHITYSTGLLLRESISHKGTRTFQAMIDTATG